MSTPLAPEHVFATLSTSLAELTGRVAAAVVQVHGRPRRPASGIVIAPERVLTTAHSVESDAPRVRAADGQWVAAQPAGEDPSSDLVLLRVPGLPAAPVPFGEAPPRIGELGLLCGRSWRGGQQVQLTMIGGIGGPVQTMGGGRLQRVLQLTAPVHAGFSGSGVFGPDGALVAVATAGLVRGAALALAAAVVQPIVDALEERGTMHRGYLGVATQAVHLTDRQHSAVGRDEGLLVMNVAAGSPAAEAGLLVGDVIVSVGDQPLDAPEDLLAWLGPERVGEPVALRVARGDQAVGVQVTVGRRPARP